MGFGSLFLLCLCAFILFFSSEFSPVHGSIPGKFDGFIYGNNPAREDSIIIEAFMDPICSDSRDSWEPLKLAFEHYSPHVFLMVHPFPLPYHDNAYVASRALHIANQLNSSSTFPLLELFFKYQGNYYNTPTEDMSRSSIVNDIAILATNAVGDNSLSAFKNGFNDPDTDTMTRTSFKYGCSRGVSGAPYFFVNGFLLPGAGSPLSYTQWTTTIEPLLSQQSGSAWSSTHLSSF